MSTTSGPNPVRVAWSVWRARGRRPPRPTGEGSVDHSALSPILEKLRQDGVPALVSLRPLLAAYRDHLVATDPDTLHRDQALAYWLNLYNAGALDLAAETAGHGSASVLRVPGGFSRPWARVAGEVLSLDDIEHGKIRRFGNPRIHGALVCGSASCPTLRYEPYQGVRLDAQLDDQLCTFLSAGGATVDRASSTLHLSRVFLWYGGDFTRPTRMPTWLPPRRRDLATALADWMDDEAALWVRTSSPRVRFQSYDWSLACAVR